MSELVDHLGRPLSARTEPDIVSPAGVPLRSGRVEDKAHGRIPAHGLPTRVRWRALLSQALGAGWDPSKPEPAEGPLCVDVPLRDLLEVLVERDVLVALVRGRDGFGHETCNACKKLAERCVCDAGICWLCGCTEEGACEGGCSWADDEQRVCSRCVDGIALEDLKLLELAVRAAKSGPEARSATRARGRGAA